MAIEYIKEIANKIVAGEMLIYLSDQDYRAKWPDQSDKIYPLRYRTCVRPCSYSIDSSSFSRLVPERRGWDAYDSVEPAF